MNSKELMEFHSKECKQDRHSNCARQWEGFGFNVICKCDCHQNNKKGKDVGISLKTRDQRHQRASSSQERSLQDEI